MHLSFLDHKSSISFIFLSLLFHPSLFFYFLSFLPFHIKSGCYFTSLPANTATGAGCGQKTTTSATVGLSTSCSVSCATNYLPTVTTWNSCTTTGPVATVTWSCYTGISIKDMNVFGKTKRARDSCFGSSLFFFFEFNLSNVSVWPPASERGCLLCSPLCITGSSAFLTAAIRLTP